MNTTKISLIFFLLLAVPYHVSADFEFRQGSNLSVALPGNEAEVVQTALQMFARDYTAVFGGKLTKTGKVNAFIGTLGNFSEAEKLLAPQRLKDLRKHREGYILQVQNNRIIIVGSDKRGTAYGILELSRRIGVSPWVWWADSTIPKQSLMSLKNGLDVLEYPSVKYRGIFINDEDFGLMPWSSNTYEPTKIKGQIGPKTHARIFELLLRLRANTFWPAMHEVSVAFYQTQGNKEMADKYGIVMGSSHCEPMMRNANTEWKIDGAGNYDYVNNRENVLRFWQSRVNELKKSDNIYTLGIRGVHDGKMQGATTLKEQKEAITNIFKDQRQMIANSLNSDLEKVPQVFIPYKEVLEVYDMGLTVPDDVTLMWTDDNYGYIRRFPSATEKARKGGNGVYYHISYWGRPHDYLWLATTHPAQIYTQMKLAYDKGAQDMWILNVGDIKPGEYLTELFLDMAWNINAIEDSKQGLAAHLEHWLAREFGDKDKVILRNIMDEYYRLAYIRKPEFMSNSRTEEKDPKYKEVTDLPWSEAELKNRISSYQQIADKVVRLSKTISVSKRDAWFQLIAYPVLAAAEMNKKMVYAQLARHGLAPWTKSYDAYQAIENLTMNYQNLAGGKWKNMINAKPRNLSVFQKPPMVNIEEDLIKTPVPVAFFNGNQYTSFSGKAPITHGLGYESAAISLKKGNSVSYEFKAANMDSVNLLIALAPNHPVEGRLVRFEISVDGGAGKVVDFHTYDRSEEWKNNVISNQAIRKISAKLSSIEGAHKIKISAVDEGIVLDQIRVYHTSP